MRASARWQIRDARARAARGQRCPRTSLQPRAQHAPARRDTVLERPRHYTNDWGWGRNADTRQGTWTYLYIGPPARAHSKRERVGASGLAFCRGNIQDCGHARIDCQAWRLGTAGRPGAATSASRAVCVHACWVCQCVVTPLLPRMKASPYLALSWPFTYSSVCSIAMFMKPSRHASTPVPQLASSAYA